MNKTNATKRGVRLLIAVFLFGMAMGYIAGLWQQAAQHEKKNGKDGRK